MAMTPKQVDNHIVYHRRFVKAHDAFAWLVAKGKISTKEQVLDLCHDLEYGKSILADLQKATHRKSFSRKTALVLQKMLLQYAVQMA